MSTLCRKKLEREKKKRAHATTEFSSPKEKYPRVSGILSTLFALFFLRPPLDISSEQIFEGRATSPPHLYLQFVRASQAEKGALAGEIWVERRGKRSEAKRLQLCSQTITLPVSQHTSPVTSLENLSG